MVIPPPPPGSQPLPGAPLVDLTGQILAQWADKVQEVASHMRLPPQVAAECPDSDIVGVLNRLEGMTRTQYCRHCFGVGQQCRCTVAPQRAPGPTMALWTPPVVSYVAMASSTETTVSTLTVGTARSWYPTSEMPPLESMDMSPPFTMEELLRTAGIGRGGRGRTPPQTPTAPGLHQLRPRTPQPQVPAPGRQASTAQTPYRQQVFLPPAPAPRPSAATRAPQSQGREGPANEETGTRGRSSSWGPRDRQRAPRSSTRGSQKCRRGAPAGDLMDEMANYVASGWKRDLVHMIDCCWVAQEGPLGSEAWRVAIEKFISVMVQKKREWTDVKELTPLQYMPYVARLFCEVTGKDLHGLG